MDCRSDAQVMILLFFSSSSHNIFLGCGKCCQVEGEVWLDTDEVADIACTLNVSAESFFEQYVDSARSGWVKLKNKVNDDASVSDNCIFLDSENRKSCTVYQSRPLQCRTYPYWPRLLTDESSWEDESVVPDDQPGKHWSAAAGGCEGINHNDAKLVTPDVISRNMRAYKSYMDAFPFTNTGDDENRIITKADVIMVCQFHFLWLCRK